MITVNKNPAYPTAVQQLKDEKAMSILLIDDLGSLPYRLNAFEQYEDMKKQLIEIIKNLKLGITQMTTHPSIITDELKAVT